MIVTTVDSLKIMTADSDKWLLKDSVYSKIVYLGKNAVQSDWQEVSDAYYRAMTEEPVISKGTINKLLDASITSSYILPDAMVYDHFEVYIQKTDSSSTPLTVTGMIMGEPVPLDSQGNHVTYFAKDGYWYIKENN